MQTSEIYLDYIAWMIFFSLLALGANWIARSKGYFILPIRQSSEKTPLSFKSILLVFGTYLGMTMVVAVLLLHLVQAIYRLSNSTPPEAEAGMVQLGVIILTILLFFLYTQTLAPSLRQRIIKDRSIPNPKTILGDMGIGVATWVLAFPVVVAIGQLIDLLLYIAAEYESYEQVAIRYLKTSLASPPLLTVALFIILLAAPAIEEFLFRGFLQTYFKRFMSVKWAIFCSSLCFALFHFSTSQGIGNISLIASLFAFALYLGFIYERQASLFASFALHVTFNTASTLRVLFFPDS